MVIQIYQHLFRMELLFTPSDNVILSDYKNNALHVLNSRGELLGLQFVDKEYNIEDPNSLCIDSERYLIIGCGLLSDNGAKICITTIAENFI